MFKEIKNAFGLPSVERTYKHPWEIEKYEWEDKLYCASDYSLDKIGMSREELHELLTKLSEEGIVN